MTKTNPKIIFIGTSSFAVPALESLVKKNYNILAVVTSPDKPAGRRQELTSSLVKKTALKYNLPILQPEKISEISQRISKLKPDLIVLAAYGQIIPKSILDIPSFGCLNLHPSLLPKYRGPSPIQTAILNGDKTTGLTIIKMDEKIDHGPIIAQTKIEITPDENSQALEQKLAQTGADLLIKMLPDYLNGKIKPKPQDEKEVSYTKIFTRQDGQIDWNQTAQEIERKIRAFYPWPGTWTYLNKKRVKIIKAKAVEKENQTTIKTKKGYLLLEIVQPEGKKPMTGEEYFRGHKLDIKG
jgi:methionyl-tRNA formyltransferase